MEFNQTKTRQQKTFVVMLSILLVFTLLVSAFPQASVSAVTCKFKHKVVQGETLIYIGNLYTVDWLKIAQANNMSPPYTVAVGQVLCIPEGEKPANTTSTSTTNDGKSPAIQVVPGLSQILVSVENFSKRTSYYVRVSPASDNVTYRLGHFTTNKEGDSTNWFRLPNYVKRSRIMTLCVKNVWTDAVSCVKYDDIFTSYPFVTNRCTTKSAR